MARKKGARDAAGLEISAETVEPCQVRLTVIVSPEREAREMDLVAQDYARHLRVPGYRPGKVPTHLVASQVGEETLREEAQKQMAEKLAREAIRAAQIDPYGTVVLEDMRADPLTYVFLVPSRPEVDLGDYRALRVPEPELEPVTAEEVAERLERLRQRAAHLETVERPAEAEDLLTVSLVGRLDDAAVVELESIGLHLSPEGASEVHLPPAVAEALIGTSAGEGRRFTVTYSEFWPEAELQGREVAFEAVVEGVAGKVVPELDDDFAAEHSDFETLAELEANIWANLGVHRALEYRQTWTDAAAEALAAAAEVRYPPQLLEAEIETAWIELRQRVEREGFTWERWVELQGRDEDELHAVVEQQAADNLRLSLTLAEFASAEGLRVSRAEIEGSLRRQQQALEGTGIRLRRTEAVRQQVANSLLSQHIATRLLDIVSGKLEGVETPAEGSAGGDDDEDAPAAEAAGEAPGAVAVRTDEAAAEDLGAELPAE